MDNRLRKIAEVSAGYKKVIDVGTDHGYLPVYLIENNIVESAIVSDVSKGSLKKAVELISKKNLSKKIESRCGNGLKVLNGRDNADLAVIAGMGGNLIAEIIEQSMELITKTNLTLILQPMQNPEVLRNFLISKKFSITKELLAEEDEKIYQIIVSKFGGSPIDYSDFELEFGRKEFYSDTVQMRLYNIMVKRKIVEVDNIIKKIRISKTQDRDCLISHYNKRKSGLEKLIGGNYES